MTGSSPPVVSNAAARRAFMAAQGLSAPGNPRLTRAGLHDLIEDLGFVQVDSINTVERAHHMILFARNRTYRPAQLAHLLEREARLFENWTHDASVIPTKFYPYWQARFVQERDRLRARWSDWHGNGFEAKLDEVLDHVRDSGPVMARHLESDTKKNAGGWWEWHPSKAALEYLWRTGDLAVARREGFQKVYDLTERVIPAEHRAHEPSREDFVDWACRSALDRLGAATSGELAAFWGGATPEEAAQWCKRHLGRGLVRVLVEPADGGKPKPSFAWEGFAESLADLPEPPGRIRVLSPFDPLLRDRKRTERLFGFYYRIEVFVPEAKRQYGYYVFPLLEGARLVGRIDMKRGPEDGALNVTGLWLEPRLKYTPGRRDRLEAELERQRAFVGAERVAFADGYLKTER